MNGNTTPPFADFLRSVIDFFQHPFQPGSPLIATIDLTVAVFAFAIVVLIVAIAYTSVRIREHRSMVKHRDAARRVKIAEEKSHVNPKWKKVLAAANSGNESAYRLAIIDADSILDEMLDFMGARGDGVQEKLKSIPRGDLKTIDLAFEAHGIRNAVAHAGADFQLSEREARRVIGLYQKVFEEKKII